MSRKTIKGDKDYIDMIDAPFKAAFPDGVVHFPQDTKTLDSIKITNKALKTLRAARYAGAVGRLIRATQKQREMNLGDL